MKKKISHTSPFLYSHAKCVDIDDETIRNIRRLIRDDNSSALDELLKKIIESSTMLSFQHRPCFGSNYDARAELVTHYPISFVNNSIFTYAAKLGANNVINYCLKFNINPNIPNGEGKTALAIAEDLKHTTTANVISANGGKVLKIKKKSELKYINQLTGLTFHPF